MVLIAKDLIEFDLKHIFFKVVFGVKDLILWTNKTIKRSWFSLKENWIWVTSFCDVTADNKVGKAKEEADYVFGMIRNLWNGFFKDKIYKNVQDID